MRPLDLPKMFIQSVYEYDKPFILEEINQAKTILTFYQTLEGEGRLLFTGIGENVEAPIKLTTSGRGKLTTCFAGEDLVVQVCQC